MTSNAARALTLISLLFGSFTGTAKSATLIAHWRAENDFVDSSPNGHDATQTGTVGFRTGGDGTGFDLSANNFLTVTSLAGGTGLAGGSLTVSAWFREDSPANSGSIANLRPISGGNDSGFTLEPRFGTPGDINFQVWVPGDIKRQVFASGFAVGELHHVAGVFDAAAQTISVYRNGVLVASESFGTNDGMNIEGDETFWIGRNVINDIAFNGMVDELMIFDGPLTPSEVQALVPEPSSFLLAGLGSLVFLRRSRSFRVQ